MPDQHSSHGKAALRCQHVVRVQLALTPTNLLHLLAKNKIKVGSLSSLGTIPLRGCLRELQMPIFEHIAMPRYAELRGERPRKETKTLNSEHLIPVGSIFLQKEIGNGKSQHLNRRPLLSEIRARA